MFKRFMGKSTTTRADVVMAFAGALIGVWKAADTYKEYKLDQEREEGELA